MDGFNTFSIYQVLPQLIELWGLNVKTDVEAKKNFVRQTVNCLLYTSPQFMDDANKAEREKAMHFNYVLLGKCKEVWVFGGVITHGMAHEISIARKRHMVIRWFTPVSYTHLDVYKRQQCKYPFCNHL